MDHFVVSISERMSKVENSLLDLNKEILISFKYLLHLKKNSTEVIKNLNSITTPVKYLKEFMDVNSFILNYLSFLTEVNCKFEMLEMSHKEFINSLSITEAITSEAIPKNINKLDSLSSSESLLGFKSNESNTDSKKVTVEQPSESDNPYNMNPPKTRKSRKKKSRKYKKTQCNTKKSANNNINKNYKIVDNNYNSYKNEHRTKIEKENDSESNCNSINFSKKKTSLDIKKDMLCCNNLDEKKSNCFNQKVSDSKAVLPSKNFLNDINVNKAKQTLSTNGPYNASLYLANKCTANTDNVFNEIQSPFKNIPAAGILPSRISEERFGLEVSNCYNCFPSSKNESLKVTQVTKSEAKISKNEDDIKPANILRKIGEEYDVTLEHIQSPSEFYISVINDQSNLLIELEKKLKVIPENKIKTFSKNIEDKKSWLCKEIGNYALFYSKCDEIWCRVKIINWCLNFKDDFVNVLLIDYGESKCVSVDDLQPMPESFKKYPAFTQRCHLHNVFPLDMDKNIKALSWEKESSEKMKSLTENSKRIKIKVAPDDCYHPLNSLPVTLWLVDKGNQCVNDLLVKSKCAIQRSVFDLMAKSEITVEENENLKNWNPMKEDFESCLNLYDLDINDPASFIYGYIGKDYERICLDFAKTGYCFKGEACRKEHQKLDRLGFTKDQEEVYKNSFNILQVPPPNSVINVQVTCILSFNQFCCISKDQISSLSNEENLQSLLKFMNNAENVRDMKKLLIPPSVGQIVIARYSEDCSWYRSRVLDSEPEKDMYTVIFVDYGNKETVHLSDIRAIEARYLHLPFQAMRCYIFGIDRNPEVPLKDVMYYLNERIGEGHISIEIVARLPGDDVKLLVRVFDHRGRNIGEDLIANKYSTFKEEMVISSDSLSIPG